MAQDPITRLLIKEIGDNMHPGKGEEMASNGIPYIPCKWNGYHPDSLVKGMRTNILPDFTWCGAERRQIGDEIRLISTPSCAVYRYFDHGVGMTRVLIPDDPEGKNRKRLAKMQEMVKEGKIKKAEYEIIQTANASGGLLAGFSAEEIAQLKELLGTAPAAPAAEAPAAEEVTRRGKNRND